MRKKGREEIGGAAALQGLGSLGLGQRRIHSTESPNPTPCPLRDATGGLREAADMQHSATKAGAEGKIERQI